MVYDGRRAVADSHKHRANGVLWKGFQYIEQKILTLPEECDQAEKNEIGTPPGDTAKQVFQDDYKSMFHCKPSLSLKDFRKLLEI